MFKAFAAALVFLLPANLALAAFEGLPDKDSVVPKEFSDLGYKAQLGEIWGLTGAPADAPQYCLIKGKVVCVTYAFDKAQLVENASWDKLDGLAGLPPVDRAVLLFEPATPSLPERFRLVLFFGTEEDMRPWVN